MKINVKFDQVCVYLHKIDNAVLYVGIGSADRAFNARNRPKSWKKATAFGYEVEILGWYNREDAMQMEKSLIQELQPPCNLIYSKNYVSSSRGNKWALGRKHSNEAKLKMAESQKIAWERGRTGRRRRPIKCVESGVIYDGLSDAAKKTGIHVSTICDCINGRSTMAHGLRFVRLDV